MVRFSKLQGTGNDFAVFDNRSGDFYAFVGKRSLKEAVRAICERRRSVGADGLILIEKSEIADFRWRFFNSDGSEAEMCGNGARCAARFAFERGISGRRLTFETAAGTVDAEVNGRLVKVRLPDPRDLILDMEVEGVRGHFIDTGVPHFVVFVEDVNSADVSGIGRRIRFSKRFHPKGTNVNFVSVNGTLKVRTYERGVESETLACGTGSVASALISSVKFNLDSPVTVETRSGERLTIYFEREGERFRSVYLEGITTWIYDGSLREELFEKP